MKPLFSLILLLLTLTGYSQNLMLYHQNELLKAQELKSTGTQVAVFGLILTGTGATLNILGNQKIKTGVLEYQLPGMQEYIWGAALTVCGAAVLTTGLVLVGVSQDRKAQLTVNVKGTGLNLCYKF